MHTRNAPFALFLGAGPGAKELGERQIPVLNLRVCSPHFTRLFHQLNETEELGPWAVSAAGTLEMYKIIISAISRPSLFCCAI